MAKLLSSSTDCACFNPSCRSKVFANSSNLLHHFATKQECRDWYVSHNKNQNINNGDGDPSLLLPQHPLLSMPMPVEKINEVSPDL
jgi:hypothetical protein